MTLNWWWWWWCGVGHSEGDRQQLLQGPFTILAIHAVIQIKNGLRKEPIVITVSSKSGECKVGAVNAANNLLLSLLYKLVISNLIIIYSSYKKTPKNRSFVVHIQSCKD